MQPRLGVSAATKLRACMMPLVVPEPALLKTFTERTLERLLTPTCVAAAIPAMAVPWPLPSTPEPPTKFATVDARPPKFYRRVMSVDLTVRRLMVEGTYRVGDIYAGVQYVDTSSGARDAIPHVRSACVCAVRNSNEVPGIRSLARLQSVINGDVNIDCEDSILLHVFNLTT